MRLVKQRVDYLQRDNQLELIELAGRVCYKSEDKISSNSHMEFISKIVKLGHTSVLEHGSVYLEIDIHICPLKIREEISLNINPSQIHFQIRESQTKRYIYTNYRYLLKKCPELFEALINNQLPKGIVKFEPKIDDPYRRFCFKFITNRGISHELVRHRVFSFSQESTRFCDYSSTKHILNERHINYIIPVWLDLEEYEISNMIPCPINDSERERKSFMNDLLINEDSYFAKRDMGWEPSRAREVLNNSTKTEVFMTGFLKDWIGPEITEYNIELFNESLSCKEREGFLILRNHNSAHKQIQPLAKQIQDTLISLGVNIEDFRQNIYF